MQNYKVQSLLGVTILRSIISGTYNNRGMKEKG